MRSATFILLMLCPFIAFTKQEQSKQLLAEQVFKDLVAAYGSNKGAPSLKILPKTAPKVIARYIAYPSATVQLDEDVYDICMSFGSNSPNALAAILSHELAHYYNDHQWCSDYAFALRNSDLGKTLNKISKETKVEKESIADSHGFFYACIAGYRPEGIFNQLLDKIYIRYKLPETAAGYPSKKERKEICRVQKEKIENLVPVFEAGIALQYLNHYQEAAACFEYLTRFFPSREIYNNYGACKLYEALKFKPYSAVSFIHPVEIDASSRIYQQNARNNDGINIEAKFSELTEAAKSAFEKAISLDRKYLRSYINLACLYNIKGNFQAALGVVNEAQAIAPDNQQLQAVKAIALYHTNDKTQAGQIFHSLGNTDAIGNYNYKLFTKAIAAGEDFRQIELWKDEWVKENVFVNTDTCGEIINTSVHQKNRSSLNVDENVSVAQIITGQHAILEIRLRTKKSKLLIDINRQSKHEPLKQATGSKLLVNNGHCLVIRQPQANWSVAYKEMSDE